MGLPLPGSAAPVLFPCGSSVRQQDVQQSGLFGGVHGGDLRTRGIGFTSLHENLDTTTPGGRLVFHVFAALAEFIRELIVQGTSEGLDAARARGRSAVARPS